MPAARLPAARSGPLDPDATRHGCGFSDQATFGRAFRAAYSRTPDEVRRGRSPGGLSGA